VGLEIEYMPGQTPIDEDEKEGLLLEHVTTRSELDEFEQFNNQQALKWARARRFTQETVLSEAFVCELHKRMYGEVWNWAGEFRRTNKNIGVDKYEIAIELRKLLDDCRYWIAEEKFDADEISIRFKHRLVFIHCFPNGNGRHSRLMADILSKHVFGNPEFSWGRKNLAPKSDARTSYLRALRQADAGEMMPLIAFARS
jgi:Fic-DOC domain mobile mystery protein B